jgi:hypothetical protein
MANELNKQIIARALEIIVEQGHWTHETFARTASHQRCSWSDPKAAKFCAIGALNRAAMEAVKGWGCSYAMRAEELVVAANSRVGKGLSEINDDEGHEVILAMFRTALERLEA